MFDAKIILDSISPEGVRLTTFEVEYPHAVHKDIMTHRALSRNFKTYRGFPPEKIIEDVTRDAFKPEVWYERVKGMEDGEPVTDAWKIEQANNLWRHHVQHSIMIARSLNELGISKSQVNFPVQDLTWIRGVITATEWDNFFALRTEINPRTGRPKARPEVFEIASMMKRLYEDPQEQPRELQPGEWALPYVSDEELGSNKILVDGKWQINWQCWKEISAARCARVSFLTHDGVRDLVADIHLHDGLREDLHMSPFEHQATPIPPLRNMMGNIVHEDWSGNFRQWHQYRKEIPNEANASLRDTDLVE